jgi:cytochrome c553
MRSIVPRGSALLAFAAALLAGAAAGQAQPPAATLAACAACHGPGGNAADGALPSLAAQPRVFIENQLVLIREGLRDVPAMTAVMTGMADSEIVALAQYFSAQPVTPRAAAPQPDQARLGEQAARRMLCGTCHLSNFQGQAQVPRLAQQNEDYLRTAMRQFRDAPGPGRDTIMAASLYGVSDAELANLAHFLAHFRSTTP